MRITASVLRGFIRETLLREAPLGPLPGDPGKVVKNKSVLMQLQAIIGASQTGIYDVQTENAWDEFIDKNVKAEALTGAATIDTIKSDWSTAAKDVTYQDDKITKFTPDIKGMLNFAMIVEPVNAQTAQTVAAPAVVNDVEIAVDLKHRPYLTDFDPPDMPWPSGVTLRDAELWFGYIDHAEVGDDQWKSANVIWPYYNEFKDAILAGKVVQLVGVNQSERDADADDEGFTAINVDDVRTLDNIFNG